MGKAPALCRGSPHGHCAWRMLRCSRLHAQPPRPASCVRTTPLRAWAGADRGSGEGSAGGAGGFAAAGEGAGLDSPGARRWKLPSAAGCTTPGCGRGKGADGGRACVGRGCWPQRRPARLPGRVPEAGDAVLGVGAARAPRSGDQPGTVGSRWERGGHRLAGAPRAAAVPAAFALQSPSPREPPYSMLSPPSALPASSILWWGGGLRYLSLAPPCCGPSAPSQLLQVGQGSPQPQGLWRTGGRARPAPDLPSELGAPWGSRERGSRPWSCQRRGFCTPWEPPRGLGGGGAVTSSRGWSRLNQVEGGAGGAPCPEGSPPS